MLRRLVGADGRSRAFVNDEPASVGLLRELGDSLVEIQGQVEQRGLLDPANHRMMLDAFAEHSVAPNALAKAWHDWREARQRRPRRRGCSPRAAPKRTCCGTTWPSSMRWRRKATRRIGSPPAARCCRMPSGWARR